MEKFKRPSFWVPIIPREGISEKSRPRKIIDSILNFLDLLPYPVSDPYEGLSEKQERQVRFAMQQIMHEFKNSLNKRDYYELSVEAAKVVKNKGSVSYQDLHANASLRAILNISLAAVI